MPFLAYRLTVVGCRSWKDPAEAEQLFVDPDGCFKVVQGLKVLHVPHMLAQKGIPVTGQTKGVLQFRAAGQDGRRLEGELQRKRSVSPGTADGLGCQGSTKPDAVVITGIDLSIVEEKPIREMAETHPSLFVALSNGFFRQVSARHDRAVPHHEAEDDEGAYTDITPR
jgi:hypothetical protein